MFPLYFWPPQGLYSCDRRSINNAFRTASSQRLGSRRKQRKREPEWDRRVEGFSGLSYGGSPYLWIITSPPRKAIFHKQGLSRSIHNFFFPHLSWYISVVLSCSNNECQWIFIDESIGTGVIMYGLTWSWNSDTQLNLFIHWSVHWVFSLGCLEIRNESQSLWKLFYFHSLS